VIGGKTAAAWTRTVIPIDNGEMRRNGGDGTVLADRQGQLLTWAMGDGSGANGLAVSASVIIPAYSMARWDQLVKAVDSCQIQSRPPEEIIVCIDHNQELLERCSDRWSGAKLDVPVQVVANRFAQDHLDASVHQRAHGSKRRFGAGWARNSGAEIATGDVLVFLDDDAWAEPDWLEHLLAPFADDRTVAVGGAPLPEYQTRRPGWFPPNFDWVFGCAYEGLPTELAPLAHLIGANMSVRYEAFEKVEGFHSIDFDDLDLCMRVATAFPHGVVLFEPRAVVRHFVPAERVAWRYFWRRCFFVNREKVEAFDAMGSAANLHAEVTFVRRALTVQVKAALAGAAKGHLRALAQLGVMLMGIGLAGLGNLTGRAILMRRRSLDQQDQRPDSEFRSH
jgi:glucosyl-dolichyl phosphate glucuronosyltransferase